MLADYLRSLMDYHEWATQRVLGACIDINESDYHRDLGLTAGTIHGALNSELIQERQWRNNYLGNSEIYTAPFISSRDTLAAELREECRQWRIAVESLTDESVNDPLIVVCNEQIKYTMTRGDLISQVINHGIQERATIAYSIDWLGQPKPAIDFIAYQMIP